MKTEQHFSVDFHVRNQRIFSLWAQNSLVCVIERIYCFARLCFCLLLEFSRCMARERKKLLKSTMSLYLSLFPSLFLFFISAFVLWMKSFTFTSRSLLSSTQSALCLGRRRRSCSFWQWLVRHKRTSKNWNLSEKNKSTVFCLNCEFNFLPPFVSFKSRALCKAIFALSSLVNLFDNESLKTIKIERLIDVESIIDVWGCADVTFRRQSIFQFQCSDLFLSIYGDVKRNVCVQGISDFWMKK